MPKVFSIPTPVILITIAQTIGMLTAPLVIFIGGLMLQKSRKEIEAHIYLRRIKIPILHIVGKLDGIFEYEDSFLPWNKLIGTPEEDKFIIAVDNAGHGDGISKNIIINNHLELLKKYN